jgi:hypothetical protein
MPWSIRIFVSPVSTFPSFIFPSPSRHFASFAVKNALVDPLRT